MLKLKKLSVIILIVLLTLSTPTLLVNSDAGDAVVIETPNGATITVDPSGLFSISWEVDFTDTTGFQSATLQVIGFPVEDGFAYAGYTAFDSSMNPVILDEGGNHDPVNGDVDLTSATIPADIVTFNIQFTAPATPSTGNAFGGTRMFSAGNFPPPTDWDCTVDVVADYGVSLNPTTSSESELTGTSIEHIITVNNEGNIADSFSLSYSGDGSASYSPASPIALGVGGSQDVTITMSGLSDGANTGTLTATSVGDPSESASATLNSFVETTGVTLEETVTTSPVIGPLDQDIEHTITITNTGNIADTFDLAVDAGDAGIFGTNPVSLGAGASTTFTFTHEPNLNPIADYTKTSTIRATSQTVGATTTTLAGVESQFKNYDATVTPDLGNPDVVLLGNDIVLDYTIENTGGLTDSFTLTTTEGTLNPTSFTDLASGDTDTFTLTIPSPTHGNHNPTIEVTSDGASGVVETVTPSVDVVTVDVELTPDQAEKTVRQSNEMVYTITVENDGLDEDTYDLTAMPGAGDPTPTLRALGGGAPITDITVAAGGSEQFEVYYPAATAEGDYIVDITATSTLDPSPIPESDTITLTSHFNTYGVALTLTSSDPLNIRQGQDAVHTFQLENTGSETDIFDLTTTGGTLSTTTLTVAAGETATFNLKYTSPAAGLNQQDDVTATSQGSQTYGPLETDTVTVTTNVKTYGVTVENAKGEQLDILVNPAGIQVHTFTVENTGNDADTFTLSLTGDGTLSDATLTIPSANTATFTVTHDGTTPGIYASKVTVTSQGWSGATEKVTAKAATVDPANHFQTATIVGENTYDARTETGFELTLDSTAGGQALNIYKLPGNLRPEAALPADHLISAGVFEVVVIADINSATGRIYYDQTIVDNEDLDEGSMSVFVATPSDGWLRVTAVTIDRNNDFVDFTILNTHWLERSYELDFVLAADEEFVPIITPPTPPPVEPPSQDDFDDLDPEDQGDVLDDLDDDEAAKLINGTSTEKASKALENTGSEKGARILEKTDNKKAAEILSKTDKKKAAEIIDKTDSKRASEIMEETDDDTAAGILNGTSARKSREILTNTSSTKAARIMEKVDTDKVKDLVEDAAQSNNTDKISRALVETDKEKVADVLLESETGSAAKVIREMGKANLNSAAERLEEAVKKKIREQDEETKQKYQQKLKDTIENPELTPDDLADLFTEIANLPETPSTVADIFEIISLNRTLEVVDVMISKDKEQEIGLVFGYLTEQKLIEIYSAMTTAARAAVYPYFNTETMETLPELTTFSVAASVSPMTVETGEPVTVSAEISNTGDEVGSLDVVFKVDGVTEETEKVVLEGEATTTLTWAVTKNTAGTYSVDINGETVSFTVEAPPTPAEFETSNLSVSPTSVKAGEDVSVTVTVENTGEESGSYTVEVTMDGTIVDSETVTLDGGDSTTVSFTVSSEVEGSHTLEVDDLSQSFTVEAAPTGFPTTTIIIAVVIVAAVAVYYLYTQKPEMFASLTGNTEQE